MDRDYSATAVENLAQNLYAAWLVHEWDANASHGARWFGLRRDMKALFRLHAQLLLQALAILHERSDGPDVVVEAAPTWPGS